MTPIYRVRVSPVIHRSHNTRYGTLFIRSCHVQRFRALLRKLHYIVTQRPHARNFVLDPREAAGYELNAPCRTLAIERATPPSCGNG